MKKIILYGVSGCPFCHKTREYFKNKGVNFEDIDVSESPEKAKEMVEKSGQMSVPVIDFKGEIIIGFDQDRLEELTEV